MARTSVAKKGSTTVATLKDMEDELAKYAQQSADTEQAAGNFISTRGGTLTYAGAAMKNNKMKVIILDSIYENAFYANAFDPDSIESPVCFAFARGEDKENMAPHEKSTEKQHPQCMGCEQNKFGSSEKGKGKACGNRRRVAMISADGEITENAVQKATLAYLKLPVTSVAGWAYYVKGLNASLKKPYFAVVTEIGIVPDAKSQYKVTFNMEEVISDAATLRAILKRKKEVEEAIMFPYEPRTDDEPAKGRGRASAGKAKKSKFRR